MSWSLLSPDKSPTGHAQVLFSTSSTIITLDALERIDQRVSRGPFSHIRVSPNGRFLALITVFGSLWVVSSDFSRNLSEVDIGELSDSAGLPEKVEWCGDNAVVLGWGGKVVVVGPAGDSLKCVDVLYGVSGNYYSRHGIGTITLHRPTLLGSLMDLG